AKPCIKSNLPIIGNHVCAICKVELHGPDGVFFEELIKYQSICHDCMKNVQCAVNQSTTSKTSAICTQTLLW
ncbi:MAG: hypothetical protein ACK53Y_00630, partial [bacterium]